MKCEHQDFYVQNYNPSRYIFRKAQNSKLDSLFRSQNMSRIISACEIANYWNNVPCLQHLLCSLFLREVDGSLALKVAPLKRPVYSTATKVEPVLGSLRVRF